MQLQPGTYTMVVTGDDGAKVTTGNVQDRLQEILLVENPTTADKVFSFTVSKAGVYPFRLVYEQGGGGYSVRWYTADNADPSSRVLLNDFGGTPSYRALRAGSVVTGPSVSAISPTPNAVNVSASAGIMAVIKDGSTALNAASLKLFYNGTDVTPGATVGPKTGNTTKVTYKPAVRPGPAAVEEYKLVFDDPTADGGVREALLTYTVAPYADYILPDPIWLETFDNVPEGTMPAGWTTFSPITPAGYEDLDNPNSDSYLVWVVISRDRVASITAWNASQRLNTPEAYINGQRVESLIQGQFAYHESDVRSGSQYAELFSPEVNLTGKSDIYLVYHSIYTQNQDNIAGTEYSIDGGTTWLPVVYMIDKDDLINTPEGTLDAEATLTAARADTAQYQDPITGETIGHDLRRLRQGRPQHLAHPRPLHQRSHQRRPNGVQTHRTLPPAAGRQPGPRQTPLLPGRHRELVLRRRQRRPLQHQWPAGPGDHQPARRRGLVGGYRPRTQGRGHRHRAPGLPVEAQWHGHPRGHQRHLQPGQCQRRSLR
ncbi:MAG: hypothetical protein M5U12_11680 [Verrucomicrobia bacterium]|nr:hypothetical protein [Verrucomicrobiota bacterium]